MSILGSDTTQLSFYNLRVSQKLAGGDVGLFRGAEPEVGGHLLVPQHELLL